MIFEPRQLSYQSFLKSFQSDIKNMAYLSEKSTLSNLASSCSPIIIDFGSDTMKAGYSLYPPTLVMRSIATKFTSLQSTGNQVGHSYQEMDIIKNAFVDVYEKNLIQHHFKYEQCCDHIFSNLECQEQNIQSPLLITETLGNPQYIRQQQIELFFECYNVEELFIGVDGLLAYFYELGGDLEKYQKQTRLVINFGAHTTHVIPIIRGRVDYSNIRRLNVGGNNAYEMFSKLITLKNPSVKKYLTNSFLRHLYQSYCEVSYDYVKQLNYFRNEGQVQKKTAYKNKIAEQNKQIQKQEPSYLINPIEVVIEQPQLELSLEYQQRREEVKKMMSQRLREALERKKNEKTKLHQEEYNEIIDLKKRYDEDPDNVNDELIELFGENNSYTLLKKKIKVLEGKLGLPPSEPQQKKANLLEVPDHELDLKGLRMKRLQEYRKRAAQQKQKKMKQAQEQQNRLRLLREENPQQYLDKLKTRYNQLSAKMKDSQKHKQQQTSRNSLTSRQKIRNIISLEDVDLEDQNFGENEEDWKLYNANEESDHQSELDAIEEQLRDVDPSWMQSTDKHHLNTGNTIYLNTELIRCPEIYFQPGLIGNEQMNIQDCVYSSLKYYDKETQEQLLKDVLMVGGGCLLRGLKERLEKQLMSNFEIGAEINVSVTKEPVNGAYLGMAMLVNKYPEYVQNNSYTKVQYEMRKIKTQQHLFNYIIWQ